MTLFKLKNAITELMWANIPTFIENLAVSIFKKIKTKFIHSFILRSFIHQWLYSPLLGSGVLFSFVNFFLHSR
jgi:hypothetical protein